MAQLLRRLAPAREIVSQQEQLFRRMVFNILIDNTDDHEKNHVLLRGLICRCDARRHRAPYAIHRRQTPGSRTRSDPRRTLTEERPPTSQYKTSKRSRPTARPRSSPP
ncbi:MAG: HipA domain-containing protein [Betaproteobacteria bacterium]